MVHEGLLSIGEFFKVVGLTIKSLRLNHDRDLLELAWIDQTSGYHY